MKNLFLGAALCALVVTGCSKQDEVEAVEPEQGEAVNVTINGTRHETPSTRTEYEEGADKLIVKWNSDKSDKLGVFTKDNGSTSNAEFSVTGDLLAEGKAANFTGSLTVSDPNQETTVYGYYPYGSTVGNDPAAIPINLGGQEQVGITEKASLAHLAAKDYLAATPVTKKFSDGDQSLSLAFNPLLTIMSFEIKQAMNVKSIKLETVGTTHPTPFYTDGTVDITTADKTFPITSSGTAQSYVELNVTNGTIAAGATGMFNMMIFPIATGEMPAYFKATVTTVDGTTYVQIKKAPTAGFVRGKRYIMELGDLASTKWDGTYPAANANAIYSGGNGTQATPFLIASAKDFAQFAANGKGYSSGKFFRLESDINLNENSWTPIASFSGYFDGGQHTVSQVNVNSADITAKASGLFAQLSGTVTIANLHVRGNVSLGTVTDKTYWWYAGGICGITQDGGNATISGCSFDGTVTGGWAGGICGISKAVTTITACRNSGEIIATRNSTDCYTGGILGRHYNTKPVNIIACYNTGKVNPVALYTGGIVGDGYSSTTVTACYNTHVESALYNVGSGTTVNACYAVAANGDGDKAWKATLFSSSWLSADANSAWTAASDADGTENKYWKSLGSWNGGTNPEYPKLWWE